MMLTSALALSVTACGGDDGGHAEDTDEATADERDAGASRSDAGKRDAGTPSTSKDAGVTKADAGTRHDAAVSTVDASVRDASVGDSGADQMCVNLACTTFVDCVFAHPGCGLTACTNQRCTK